jgi:hypothetical protein
MVYTAKHIRIIRVTAAAAVLPVIGSSENDVQLRTRHPETTADEAYSSPGNKGACAIHFFARPYSTASLKFIFHRFFAEQALEFFNLLHGGSKFRGRNDLFSGSHSSKTSSWLLTPEK